MLDAYFSAIERLVAAVDVDYLAIGGILTRMAAIAFLAPGLGEPAVPVRVRLAAVLAMTIIAAPLAPARAPVDPGIGAVMSVLGAEAVAGLIIGFALRMAVFVLQVAGAVIAQSLSLSQLLGPGVGHDQESALSTILIMAGLAAAAAAGLHVEIAVTAVRTYDFLPFGLMPPAADAADVATRHSGDALSLAFALSAPFVLLGFVYTLMLAAMSRAMPQLVAAFVGAPAIIFAGLTLFAGAATLILQRWSGLLERLVADPVAALP